MGLGAVPALGGAPASGPAMPAEVLDMAPARAIVNLTALCHNAGLVIAAAADLGSEVMAVIKADAYGHGAVRSSLALAACGIRAFAVGTLQEAVQLRVGGLGRERQVLVLGAPLPGDVAVMAKYSVQVVCSSVEAARLIARAAAEVPAVNLPLGVHIYAETGMTRLGLQLEDVDTALDELLAVKSRIRIAGLMTHFATADEPSSDFVSEQMDRFSEIKRKVRAHALLVGRELPLHFSNTAAVMNANFHEMMRREKGTYVRLGSAFYGMLTEAAVHQSWHALGEPVETECPRRAWLKDLNLVPTVKGQLLEVMTFAAKVTNVEVVEEGTTVGYSRTWTAPRRSLIATVGAGYADGYPRAASRKAQVGINGRFYPVAGSVCMDMTMVDLGDPEGPGSKVGIGDEAVLFGPGGISAEELAYHAGTMFADVMTGIQGRVRRVYVGGPGERAASAPQAARIH